MKRLRDLRTWVDHVEGVGFKRFVREGVDLIELMQTLFLTGYASLHDASSVGNVMILQPIYQVGEAIM
jgi:hypothetical protein